MSKLTKHFTNALKGAVIMVSASFIFVLLLTIFPLVGGLATPDLQLKTILLQHLDLFLLIAGAGIPLGVMIGILAPAIKQKRLFLLTLIGLVSYWLIIIVILLVATGFKISLAELGNIFLLSLWAMLAYSVFAIPILALVIFILERWTRRK